MLVSVVALDGERLRPLLLVSLDDQYLDTIVVHSRRIDSWPRSGHYSTARVVSWPLLVIPNVMVSHNGKGRERSIIGRLWPCHWSYQIS